MKAGGGMLLERVLGRQSGKHGRRREGGGCCLAEEEALHTVLKQKWS